MIKSSKISQSEVLVRLQKRHQSVTARLIEKHAAARKFLQASTIGGIEVVEAILSHIDERHHSRILTRIAAAPADPGILDLVNQLAGDDIEAILKRRIAAIHLDLMEDLLEGG